MHASVIFAPASPDYSPVTPQGGSRWFVIKPGYFQ